MTGKPKKKPKRLNPAAVKAARDLRKRITTAVQTEKSGGKYSAERIARAVRDLENDWRSLAADALQQLHDLATGCGADLGTATRLDLRDKGIKGYWALRKRFDNLTGQLELFS